MSTAVRLVGFLAVAAGIFGVAVLAGRVVGPVGDAGTPTHESTHVEDSHEDSTDPTAGTELPGGLLVSQDGYTLELGDATSAAGEARPVTFTITGPEGEPVTEYDVEHDTKLHLIAVRRDFEGYQHVHPVMDADGLWSTGLDLTSGSWRVYADFKPTDAEALTLGADLTVPGDHQPGEGRSEARTSSVGGYEVTLEGELEAGADSRLTLSVTQDGRPVTDLQPYLGAYGHLVALRAGDMAYLHVHPDGEASDPTTEPGPDVVFYAAVPGPGSYHLFLDFKHDGVVRTADFTVTVPARADGHTDQ